MNKRSRPLPTSENLFAVSDEDAASRDAPLSVRMRPQSLEEFIGQEHIVGKGKLLPRAIESDRLSSLILYGPPGTGKTTLAYCISRTTKAHVERLNAVAANVDDLRRVIASSQNRHATTGRKTVLFIDEIHRFNKAQQDVLMPDLEEGRLVLIGATVFNPFFSLTGPLLSRSMVFELDPLSREEIIAILKRAVGDKERGLGSMNIRADEEALAFLAGACDGDARRALNALEIGCRTTAPATDGTIHFTSRVAEESIQKKQVVYDRDGDAHYDTASAFIKSMRGSDPDAALYWMAKMIYAGEDPRFIARRICICAAEDVGNADPQALVVAGAALQVSEFVGMPEARIPLAQAAVYVACAPKSNAAYLGIEKALGDVKSRKVQEVPVHLKDASYRGARSLGHGQDYKYAHDFAGHYVEQEYMPLDARYYEPTDMGEERAIKARMASLKGKGGR
ncbi:MAG: replication-associated recombination protein A [Candidatus Omnitrophica bacterium]|nr:replication-associated recombination protein A [Candidatus Omnitrophota bacterium]